MGTGARNQQLALIWWPGLRDCNGVRLSRAGGDFLQLGGLLAANASTGFERHNVTSLAVIPHAIQLPVSDRKKLRDFERTAASKRALHLDLAAPQPVVLQG